jgi:hypothetical protein
VPPAVQLAARDGWFLAGAALLGLLLVHPGWWAWLTVPALVLVPPLLATGDLDATLAGFLAIGITVAGAVAFGIR